MQKKLVALVAILTVLVSSEAYYQLKGFNSNLKPVSTASLHPGVLGIFLDNPPPNIDPGGDITPTVPPKPYPVPSPLPPPPSPNPTPTPPPPTPTPPPPAPLVCPAPATGAFTGCYYTDKNFGNLGLVRTDNAVNFDWGLGSPDPKIPVDNFSAVWQGNFNFDASAYTFSATTDDGMRLSVDGNRVIDKFFDQGPTAYAADQTLTAGNHLVKVEYYEHLVTAVAKVSWAKKSPVVDPPPLTISILSPAGNEQWAVGSTQTIQWTSSSSVANLNINIVPYLPCLSSNPPCPNSAPTLIAANVSNNGLYKWNIPSSLTAGQYILYINDANNSGLAGAAVSKNFNLTSSANIGAVTVTSLSPTTGPVGTSVTVTGTGFTSTGNAIQFGAGATLSNINSADGVTLQFTVPKQTTPCVNSSAGSACGAGAAALIGPGPYNVSVSNANGTSSTQIFTVTGTVTSDKITADQVFDTSMIGQTWHFKDSLQNEMWIQIEKPPQPVIAGFGGTNVVWHYTKNACTGYWAIGTCNADLRFVLHKVDQTDINNGMTAEIGSWISVASLMSFPNPPWWAKQGQPLYETFNVSQNPTGTHQGYLIIPLQSTQTKASVITNYLAYLKTGTDPSALTFDSVVSGPTPNPTEWRTDTSLGSVNIAGVYSGPTMISDQHEACDPTSLDGMFCAAETWDFAPGLGLVRVHITNDGHNKPLDPGLDMIRQADSNPPLTCPSPATGAFTGCYYTDKNFGNLGLVRTENAVNFDWGLNSPDPKIPNENFSAVWQGNFNFDDSGYSFSATTDDGMRVSIDGNVIIDKFFDQPATTYTSDQAITAGSHLVKIEYYQHLANAVAKVSWVKKVLPVDPTPTISFPNGKTLELAYSSGSAVLQKGHFTFVNQSKDTAIDYAISVPNKPSWASYDVDPLHVPPGGSQSGGFSINANASGLDLGIHTFSVTITGNFKGSPLSVPVNFNVNNQTTNTVAPTVSQNPINVSVKAGSSADPVSLTVTSNNSFYQMALYSSGNWMTASDGSRLINGGGGSDSVRTIKLNFNITQLNPGTNKAVIILSPDKDSAFQNVIVPVTLNIIGSNIIQTTDADFAPGAFSNTSVVGTGTAASVQLNGISKFSANTSQASPYGIAFDSVTNSIWVTAPFSNSVSKISIKDGSATEYNIGKFKFSSGIAFDPSTNSVWVSDYSAPTLTKINIFDGSQSTITIPASLCAAQISPVSTSGRGIAFDPSTNSIWVATARQYPHLCFPDFIGEIAKINPNSGTGSAFVTGPIGGDIHNGPGSVVFDSTTNSIWVASSFGSTTAAQVIKFNNSGSIISSPLVGPAPSGMAFDPVSNSIWVPSGYNDTLSKIDVQSGNVTILNSPAYDNMESIAYNPVTKSVWMVTGHEVFVTVDVQSNAVTSGKTKKLGMMIFEPITQSMWVAEIFNGGISQIPVLGTYTSAALSGANSASSSLSWSQSGGQSITMKARSGKNIAASGSAPSYQWSNDWSACKNINSGDILNSGNCVNSDDSVIQYQATLSTNDPNSIPSLDDVTISASGNK